MRASQSRLWGPFFVSERDPMLYPPLLVKRLDPYATIPTYGSKGAIGLDLYAYNPVWKVFIDPGQRMLVKTGISIAVPEGYYGRVAPRSGLALKAGIDVLAGVIDSDYRGEVGVVLINHSNFIFEIKNGDRIAQLILERADRLAPIETNALPDTERGSDGYGSTGV